MTAVAVKGSSGFPGQLFKQSEAAGAKTTWLFHLAKSADGTDDTGVVPVVSISKAGGAFAGAAGVVSEISAGWYKVAFTNVDLGTLGALAINVAVATADTINEVAQVVGFDPYDAVRLGLTALPNAAANATGGLAAAVVRGGTAQAGAAKSITLDAGASATDDLYKGDAVYIASGTGAGQVNRVAGYIGSTKVATVEESWATNPASDSVFVLLPGTRGIATAAALADVATDVNAIDTGALPARTTTHSLGTLTTGARTSTKLSLLGAVSATVAFGGTAFHSGSVQVKVSEDGTNFVNYGSASTDNTTPVTITEPHFAVEAVLTGGDSGGTTSIPVTLTIQTNQP